MNMNERLIAVCTAALFATTMAGLAGAADLPKEGNYDFTTCLSCSHDPIDFSSTKHLLGYGQMGATVSNPPGGMFDRGAFRCVGLATTFDGKISDTRFCETVFPDGGKILTKFSRADDGTHLTEVVAGTGRYEGIVSSGVVTPLGPYPIIKSGTTQFCNRYTGTYKLK
jgi:hypothetical protein